MVLYVFHRFHIRNWEVWEPIEKSFIKGIKKCYSGGLKSLSLSPIPYLMLFVFCHLVCGACAWWVALNITTAFSQGFQLGLWGFVKLKLYC